MQSFLIMQCPYYSLLYMHSVLMICCFVAWNYRVLLCKMQVVFPVLSTFHILALFHRMLLCCEHEHANSHNT